MPVVDLGKTENTTLHIAHFADGCGWRTVINLINPSDVPISGTVSFVGYAAPIAYAIAARSSVQLVSDRSGSADIQTGSIRIIPTAGHIAPASNAVFSFQRNGITVALSSVAAQPAASGVRIYVEGVGAKNGIGSIQTGIAITNPSSETLTFNLQLSTDAGIRNGTIELAANGHAAFFLKEVPAFADLPDSFRGVLRISAATSGSFVAVALRGRYNERSDFLISATPPAAASSIAGEWIFPHFGDGGSYSMQFVLFETSGISAETGTMQFYSQTGEALPLRIF